MKISKIPLLLLLIITFNFESAEAKSFNDIKLSSISFSSCDIKSSPPSASPETKLKTNSTPTCSIILSTKELYELWIKNDPQLTVDNLDISKLNPQFSEKEKEWFLKMVVVQKLINDQKELKNGLEYLVENCQTAMFENPGREFGEYPDCKNLEEKLAATRENIVGDGADDYKTFVAKVVFINGKKNSEQKNDPIITPGGATGGVTGGANGGVTGGVTGGTTGETPEPSNVEKHKDIIPPNTMTQECKEKLSAEIAELLADKSKNIIGLQFELTVLKMASLSVSEGEKTFEGLIKKKSKELKAIDDGSIDKMNQLYKKHGLPEDASKIAGVLKVKASDPNYYNKHKRFFNNDSSAFMMAYQQVHPKSPIKEADISVLWFMDQVSEKAKKQNKGFSSEHNRTNLSTRIAQYTGAIDPKKKRDQAELDAMVTKQSQKIENEFLALIEQFKKENSQCFNGTAAEDSECNLNKVEEIFSNLLAINSKISSTDLVHLDGKLSGKINQATFSIARYVDSP